MNYYKTAAMKTMQDWARDIELGQWKKTYTHQEVTRQKQKTTRFSASSVEKIVCLYEEK